MGEDLKQENRVVYLELLNIFKDFDKVREIWGKLSSESNTGYFLSWGWIENWVESLPEDVCVHLCVIREKEVPVLTFFLGEAQILRNQVFKSKGIFLNATGNSEYDSLCIEYNTMIYRQPLRLSLRELLGTLPNHWDEFFLPGLDCDSFPGNSLAEPTGRYKMIKEKVDASPYVDLERVRRTKGGYLSLLGSNTRAQIRRTYRDLESHGPIKAAAGLTIKGCSEIFDEMVLLHQRRWQRKGEQGAFETDYFYRFHKELIKKRFDQGEIQLIRVTAGQETVGCLYNFVFRGRVYFYQSGINYEIDERLKAGLLCHAEAVKYNAAIGQSIYDFLGGAERYKSNLATNKRPLIWAKIQRPCLKFWMEDKIRGAKHWIRKWTEN